MLRALREAETRATVILITGGLGPTSDDITKPVLCEFFNTKLVFNSTCFEDVKFQFESRGIKMPDVNKGQAEVPGKLHPSGIKTELLRMWFEIPVGNKQSAVNKNTEGKTLPTVNRQLSVCILFLCLSSYEIRNDDVWFCNS